MSVLVQARLQKTRQQTRADAVQAQQAHREQLDSFVGIVADFAEPFTVFVKASDVPGPDDDGVGVHFVAYKLGLDKAILWGWYHPDTRTFEFAGQCAPDLATHVSQMIPHWLELGYKYTASVEANRYQDLVRQFASARRGTNPERVQSYADYRAKSYALALLDDKVRPEDVDRALGRTGAAEAIHEDFVKRYLPDADPDEDIDLDDRETAEAMEAFKTNLQQAIDAYAAKIKHVVVEREWARGGGVAELLKQMSDDLYEYLLSHGWARASTHARLERCPSEAQCVYNAPAEKGERVWSSEPQLELCDVFHFGESEDYT